MPLEPRKSKYRRQFQKGARAVTPRGASLAFGDYGLKVLERGNLSARQIEAARRAITHFTKRAGKVWIRVFPDKPITRKSAGAGMGGGKGETASWVAPVTAGKIIFEVAGVGKEVAQEAIRRASHKIGLRSTFVERS